jgi:hypothetical protein
MLQHILACMCQAMESGTFTNQLLVPRLYFHMRHWKSEHKRMSVSYVGMCTNIFAVLTLRTVFTIVTSHTAGYDIQQLIQRILYFFLGSWLCVFSTYIHTYIYIYIYIYTHTHTHTHTHKYPTRCNNSILVLSQDHPTCFRHSPRPSSGVQ